MNPLGYFWFGEDTAYDWAKQNAIEAATVGGGVWLAKNPKTAGKLAWTVARPVGAYAGRVGVNVTKAVMVTPIARGVAPWHILAGYLIGATVGTAISYALYGDEGAADAIELYTGQVSASDYVNTVVQGNNNFWDQVLDR